MTKFDVPMNVTLTLILISCVSTELLLNDSVTNVNVRPDVECLLDMIGQYPHHTTITLLNSECLEPPLAFELIYKESYQYSVYNIRQRYQRSAGQVVVTCAGDAAQLGADVASLRRSRYAYWEPRLDFIIHLRNSEAIVDDVISLIRSHDVYNIHLILTTEAGGFMLVCCELHGIYQRCVHLRPRSCADLTIDYNTSTTKLIPLYTTLVVAAIENDPNFIFPTEESNVRGLEQFVLESFAETLNASVQYQYLDANAGLDVELMTRQLGVDTDLVGGGLSLLPHLLQRYDYVWGFTVQHYLLLTPASQLRGCYIFDALDHTVWFLIAVAFVITTLLLLLTAKRVKAVDCSYVTLHVFGYLIMNSYPRLVQGGAFKYLFVLWLWFTFFVSCFYTTALYTQTVSSAGYCRSEPIKDGVYFVNHSESLGYKSCVNKKIRTFVNDFHSFNLSSERRECDESENSLRVVSEEKNLFTIESELKYSLCACRYVDETGRARLDATMLGASNLPALYLRRASILRPLLQTFTFNFYEGGILQAYQAQISETRRTACSLKTSGTRPCTLQEFGIPFVVLFSGYALSVTCFGLENLYEWLKRRNTRFAR